MNRHAHIHFGVARRKGVPLLLRNAYQMCRDVEHEGTLYSFGQHRAHHLGTAVLLPEGADSCLSSPAALTDAILEAERRVDAQEARTLDFALPRSIPAEHLLVVASWVLLPLIGMGMAAQVDVEAPPAADGGSNPHVHACLSMRDCCGNTFGRKNRIWNQLFRRSGGRWVRALIGSRLMAASALLGCSSLVDPRSKAAWSDIPPEPRIPAGAWVDPMRRRAHPDFRELVAIRYMTQAQTVPRAGNRDVRISNPAHGSSLAECLDAFRAIIAAAMNHGLQTDPAEPEFGASFVIRGPQIMIHVDETAALSCENAALSSNGWDCLASLLIEAGWPALIVDGPQEAVDEIGVRTAEKGLMAVNHSLSEDALEVTARRGPRALAEDVARFERSGKFDLCLNPVGPDVADDDLDIFPVPPPPPRISEADQQRGALQAREQNARIADEVVEIAARMRATRGRAVDQTPSAAEEERVAGAKAAEGNTRPKDLPR